MLLMTLLTIRPRSGHLSEALRVRKNICAGTEGFTGSVADLNRASSTIVTRDSVTWRHNSASRLFALRHRQKVITPTFAAAQASWKVAPFWSDFKIAFIFLRFCSLSRLSKSEETS